MKEVFLPLYGINVYMNERLPQMKLITTLALWVLSLSALIAQPTFTMSDEMPMPGDTVEVDVTVSDFVRISSMQYVHGYDSLVLDYVDVIDKSTNLAGLSHLGPEMGTSVMNGRIVITWNDPFGENQTLSDGETIYTLQFVAIGSECDSTDVTILRESERLGDIEILDENFDAFPPDDIGIEDGLVNIPGNDCEGGGGGGDIVIRANDASGDNGDEVCLQIRVDNFTDVESMQFSMSWDESVITYSRVANFNLINLNAGSFNNASAGSLSCVWDQGGGGSETLPNNSRIFDLCFNIVGMSGDASDVDFVDSPLPIEFNTTSGVATYRTTSGEVTVTGGGGGDEIELNMGDGNADCGDCNSAKVCIPLTVVNFTDVEAMQFSINYSTELVYCGVENIQLSGYTPGDIFNPTAGVLRTVWADPQGGAQSLGDNETMFELCFSSTSGGATYDVEVTGTPLPIEIQTSSGVADVITSPGEIEINPCMMSDTIQASLESTFDIRCHGDSTGFIQLSVSGGSGNYELIWSRNGVPFDTSNSTQQFNLPSGTYSVKITDLDDPTDMETVTNIVINEPDPLVANLVSTPVTAGCDGAAAYEVSGGTMSYFYRWSNGSRDSSLTDLCKGDYACTITDANNCVLITDTFTLSGPPLMIGQPDVTSTTCYGDCDGAIDISPTGGCGVYTYEWAPATGIVTDAQNQSDLCAGMYSVTVTDTMGNSANRTIMVNQPDSIMISLDSIQNGASGGIFISVSGGSTPGNYNYAWKDSNNVLVSQDEDITNVPPGRYIIMVVDQNGCMRMKSWTISLSDLTLSADVSEYEGGVNISCNGGSDGSINITVSNGMGPFSYSWDHDPSATGPEQTGLPAGTYRITVMDQADGATKVITVTLTEPSDALTAMIEEKSCADRPGDPTGSYEVIPSGGTAPYTYLWCNNSTARVPINLVGGENCDVLVTDANGCQIFIDNIEICSDSIPDENLDCFKGRDVITPNGDSYNEFFIITCLDDPRYQDNELVLFNRWGQTVNTFRGYVNQWNGLDEDGEELEEDTYMWVLTVTLPSGDRDVYRGAVTLLRN